MTAPIQTPDLVHPISHSEQMADAAVRDAMTAALAGNFDLVDELEVTYLNVLVRIGELVIREADGARHPWCSPAWRELNAERAPFVVAYHRGFGPEARAALEWELRTKCRRCDGKLRRVECRICGGRWYAGDDFEDGETIYTDTAGVILPGSER